VDHALVDAVGGFRLGQWEGNGLSFEASPFTKLGALVMGLLVVALIRWLEIDVNVIMEFQDLLQYGSQRLKSGLHLFVDKAPVRTALAGKPNRGRFPPALHRVVVDRMEERHQADEVENGHLFARVLFPSNLAHEGAVLSVNQILDPVELPLEV